MTSQKDGPNSIVNSETQASDKPGKDPFVVARLINDRVYSAKTDLRASQANLSWEEKVALVEQMNRDLLIFVESDK